MLSDQYPRNDIDKGGIGLLKQREQVQLEYRTLGDRQVSGRCCGEESFNQEKTWGCGVSGRQRGR